MLARWAAQNRLISGLSPAQPDDLAGGLRALLESLGDTPPPPPRGTP